MQTCFLICRGGHITIKRGHDAYLSNFFRSRLISLSETSKLFSQYLWYAKLKKPLAVESHLSCVRPVWFPITWYSCGVLVDLFSGTWMSELNEFPKPGIGHWVYPPSVPCSCLSGRETNKCHWSVDIWDIHSVESQEEMKWQGKGKVARWKDFDLPWKYPPFGGRCP